MHHLPRDRRARAILGALTLACAAAGCGARSELETARPDASRLDASRPDTSRPDAARPDAADAGPCEWTLGPAYQLSDGVEDYRLEALVVGDGRALVGMQVSDADPPHDRAWRLRAVGFDGAPLAPARVAIAQPDYGLNHGSMSGAATPRPAFAAWDERRGCQFAFVDAEGAGLSPRPVGEAPRVSGCTSLAGLADGYSLLVREAMGRGTGLAAVVLDGAGAPTGERNVLLPPTDVDPTQEVARAYLVDGTFVLGVLGPRLVTFSHHSARGVPLDSARTVSSEYTMHTLRIAAGRERAIAAWIEDSAAFNRDDEVRAVELDARGVPSASGWPPGSSRPLSEIIVSGRGDLSITLVEDHLVLVWSEGPTALPYLLRVQVRSASTLEIERTLDVEDAFLATNPIVRATPTGALIAYEAERGRMPTTVYVRELACR